jgi:hypothetical protein
LFGTDKWYVALLPRVSVPIIADELNYNHYLTGGDAEDGGVDAEDEYDV